MIQTPERSGVSEARIASRVTASESGFSVANPRASGWSVEARASARNAARRRNGRLK
jgi:hypothetical protein